MSGVRDAQRTADNAPDFVQFILFTRLPSHHSIGVELTQLRDKDRCGDILEPPTIVTISLVVDPTAYSFSFVVREIDSDSRGPATMLVLVVPEPI